MPQAQENVAVENAASSKATVTTTSASIVASRPARVSALIYNSGAEGVHINAGAAATTDHFLIPAGGSFEEREFTGAIHARSVSGSPVVYIWETY